MGPLRARSRLTSARTAQVLPASHDHRVISRGARRLRLSHRYRRHRADLPRRRPRVSPGPPRAGWCRRVVVTDLVTRCAYRRPPRLPSAIPSTWRSPTTRSPAGSPRRHRRPTSGSSARGRPCGSPSGGRRDGTPPPWRPARPARAYRTLLWALRLLTRSQQGVIRLGEQTLYWWIDHAATISAIPLALIGFGVTFWQLGRTHRAALAAKLAADRAVQQMSRITLIGLLPQLRQIDDELDRAIKEESIEGLRFWVSRWKSQASEARAHLDRVNREEARLMRVIQSSLSAASDLRQSLHSIPVSQLPDATEDFMTSVNQITSELGTIAARKAMEGSASA